MNSCMSEFVFESCDLLLEDDKTFDMLSWTYCGTCLASEMAPLTNHSAGHAIPWLSTFSFAIVNKRSPYITRNTISPANENIFKLDALLRVPRLSLYWEALAILQWMLVKLVTGNGERGTGNGKREMGNGKRETGNGERGTENGEPGTGVWERVHSGNPPENSTWQTNEKQREQFGQIIVSGGDFSMGYEFLPAVPPRSCA